VGLLNAGLKARSSTRTCEVISRESAHGARFRLAWRISSCRFSGGSAGL